MLYSAFAAATLLAGAGSTITIDATTKTPISPYVYGDNGPDWASMGSGFTISRMGGNRLTAYNWENNASNAGSDYFNENDALMGVTNQAGWAILTYLQSTQSHGAAAIVTIPTQGHVSADKAPPGDVDMTPNYINVRFEPTFASKPGGHYVYPPVTTDDAVYEDECVAYVESIKSNATPVFYMLDNEPDLWASTHSRIQLTPITYAGLIANNIQFATAIKHVAPNALVFGPVNYGWEGFTTLQNATDANGRDFTSTYLDAMKSAAITAGKRLIDSYDIHWYPEATGDGIRIVDSGDSPGEQAARIQAPRSLWDPTYVETSWITQDVLNNTGIDLLPTMFQKIATHYPGTALSISEYNYGGGQFASGMIAQADVLGIFGRYGIFAACNWGMGDTDSGMLAGFQAFINYDGGGSRFANEELGVSGTSAALNSVYAALDSANPYRMTVVAINKQTTAASITLAFHGFTPSIAKAYTRMTGSFAQPVVSSPAVVAGTVPFTMPALSVTTFQVRASSGLFFHPGAPSAPKSGGGFGFGFMH